MLLLWSHFYPHALTLSLSPLPCLPFPSLALPCLALPCRVPLTPSFSLFLLSFCACFFLFFFYLYPLLSFSIHFFSIFFISFLLSFIPSLHSNISFHLFIIPSFLFPSYHLFPPSFLLISPSFRLLTPSSSRFSPNFSLLSIKSFLPLSFPLARSFYLQGRKVECVTGGGRKCWGHSRKTGTGTRVDRGRRWSWSMGVSVDGIVM